MKGKLKNRESRAISTTLEQKRQLYQSTRVNEKRRKSHSAASHQQNHNESSLKDGIKKDSQNGKPVSAASRLLFEQSRPAVNYADDKRLVIQRSSHHLQESIGRDEHRRVKRNNSNRVRAKQDR